jgi:hypothetical protein
MGGAAGLAFGVLGVAAASRRYPAFRGLTLPFRAFLASGSGTFAGEHCRFLKPQPTSTNTKFPAIISADSYSRRFERARNPEYQFQDESENLSKTLASQKTAGQRAMTWASDNRYSIVFASWIASMGGALTIVGRSPYLTTQQKLVQARVYAQGLTMAVVIASLAFEGVDSAQGKGRWETVRYVDPNDPEHKKVIEKQIHHEKYKGEDQWMDMVAAEEERLKEREEAKEEHAQEHKKKNQHKENKDEHKSKQEEAEASVAKSKKANVP